MSYEVEITGTYEQTDIAPSYGKKTNIPIRTANELSQNYLEHISTEDYGSAEAAIKELSDFVSQVLSQDTKSGDSSDWHNWACDIARADLYDLACDILEEGFKLFPKDIDLLADYLQYGISCGRIDTCKSVYKVLSKIPKIRWSWRGYSFSVSYLQFLWDRCDSEKELDRLLAEMLELTKQFRSYLGDEEECYRSEADIYKMIHNKKQEEAVLREALEQVKIAPKCALRLADMLIDRGDYGEALVKIKRALNDMKAQASVNEGYLHFISGLSKLASLLRSGGQFSYDAVMDIYSDFNISLKQETRSAYRSTIKSKTIMLASKSDIPVPDTMEELSYWVS